MKKKLRISVFISVILTTLIAMTAIMIKFSDLISFSPKPEKVIESEWNASQPKLVAYYLEQEGTKFKVKEEKFYEDGTMEYTGAYDNEGNRHGEWKYFYPAGSIWSIGNYDHGIKTGKKEVYWPEGQLRYEGFFANDKKSGHWKFYDLEGKVIQEADYNPNND